MSRDINIIQIDLPNGNTSALLLAWLYGLCVGYQQRLAEVFNIIYKMDSKIVFEMSFMVQYVEDVRMSWFQRQRFRRYLVDRQTLLF